MTCGAAVQYKYTCTINPHSEGLKQSGNGGGGGGGMDTIMREEEMCCTNKANYLHHHCPARNSV